MAKPWYAYYTPDEHGYYPSFDSNTSDTPHFAQDIPTPQDTVLTAPWGGTVQQADISRDREGKSWGGEVFVAAKNVPGIGNEQYYMYHLDEVDVKKGQTVVAGQRLGLSGGQTSGGQHPTSSKYSTGPHTHFGFFDKMQSQANYEGLGTTYHNVTIPTGPDITPYLKQAAEGGGFAASDDPCLGCGDPNGDANSKAAYDKCHAALAAKVGTPPPCANVDSLQKELNKVTGQATLDKILKGLGVESIADLAWRALFITGGIIFILFGLIITGKALTQNIAPEVAAAAL